MSVIHNDQMIIFEISSITNKHRTNKERNNRVSVKRNRLVQITFKWKINCFSSVDISVLNSTDTVFAVFFSHKTNELKNKEKEKRIEIIKNC